jgi:hypothetical protein
MVDGVLLRLALMLWAFNKGPASAYDKGCDEGFFKKLFVQVAAIIISTILVASFIYWQI